MILAYIYLQAKEYKVENLFVSSSVRRRYTQHHFSAGPVGSIRCHRLNIPLSCTHYRMKILSYF
jgi:hypothetical protein